MTLRDFLITTMDQFAGSVRGLVVWHRGRYMRLIPDGDGDYSPCAQWSASARADDGTDTVPVIGVGATPLAALDDCANKIDAIENPEPLEDLTNTADGSQEPRRCQCPPGVIRGGCPMSYANGAHERRECFGLTEDEFQSGMRTKLESKAATAIVTSARTNSIVSLPYEQATVAELEALAEDSAEVNGVVELWGSTELGGDFPRRAEWRVHLTR